MTRQKKSRKPGPLAPSKPPKEPRAIENAVKGKKKGKGQKPGQRHSEGKTRAQQQRGQASEDPRKGSRKKVELVSLAPKQAPTSMSAEEELRLLEQDEKLQALLERFEQGDELTASEQAYLDEKSERYEQLAEQLGIDLDDDWDDEEY